MNKAATLTAAVVTAGAVLFATGSTAAPPPPPPTTIEPFVAEGAPTHVDELEPGIGPGDWPLFRDPVLNAEGEEIGVADTRVQIVAAAGHETTFAVIGGTGSYAGPRETSPGPRRPSTASQPAT